MQGLLAAFMNPPADDEGGFNSWYDEEHVPLRLAVPGFLCASRYTATENEGPRYLALYELDSVDVLKTSQYQRLAQERSDRETDMLRRIPMMDRRVASLVLDGPAWTKDAPYQLIVCMTPPQGGEDDFVDWYRH